MRKWAREIPVDPARAFPGHGQMKHEQLEIERLKREVAKLKAERDIPTPRPSSRGTQYEVGVHREAPRYLADRVLWESLDVSRSGFHAWLSRTPSQRTRGGEEIGANARAEFHPGSARTYGVLHPEFSVQQPNSK